MGWYCWSPWFFFSVDLFKKDDIRALWIVLGGFWDMYPDIEKDIYASFIADNVEHIKHMIDAYLNRWEPGPCFDMEMPSLWCEVPMRRRVCHKIILSPRWDFMCCWPWDGVFVSNQTPVVLSKTVVQKLQHKDVNALATTLCPAYYWNGSQVFCSFHALIILFCMFLFIVQCLMHEYCLCAGNLWVAFLLICFWLLRSLFKGK